MLTIDYPLLKVSSRLTAVNHRCVYLSITAVDRGTTAVQNLTIVNRQDIFASLSRRFEINLHTLEFELHHQSNRSTLPRSNIHRVVNQN